MILRVCIVTAALSLALAAFAGRAYSAAKKDAQAAHESAQQAQTQAAQCAARFDAFVRDAQARESAASAALAQAQKSAKSAAQRADAILRAPAPVPGDDCASARARAQAWLFGRSE